MSKQTVLDWQRDGIIIARGSGRGGRVALDQISYQPVGEREDGREVKLEEAVHRAAAEVQAKGEITLIASREVVEVRTLNVPRIDADELADVIRFQAQRQMSNLTDSWAVDYVMLPPVPGQEMQTALVGGISPLQLAEFDRICSGAGMQVERVLLRPIEIARFAVESGSLVGSGSTMIVCVGGQSADLLILRDGQVLQVRGTRLPSEPEQVAASLKGELRRSLMAASEHLAGAPIGNVLLISTADMASKLDAVITDATGASVTFLDPTKLLPANLPGRDSIAEATAHRLAALAGAVTSDTAEKKVLIDFKNPKKRPPKQKNTGRILLYGGAAAALLAVGGGWLFMKHKSLDAEIASYKSQTNEKQDIVKAAEQKIKEFDEVRTFLAASPNWLDELSFIAQRIPAADKVIFDTPIVLSTSMRGEATIRIPVRTNESASIGALEDSLRDDNHDVFGSVISEFPANEGYRFKTTENISVSGRGWDPFSSMPNLKPATSQGTTAETTAETNAETSAETNAETSAETNAETSADAAEAVQADAAELTPIASDSESPPEPAETVADADKVAEPGRDTAEPGQDTAQDNDDNAETASETPPSRSPVSEASGSSSNPEQAQSPAEEAPAALDVRPET